MRESFLPGSIVPHPEHESGGNRSPDLMAEFTMARAVSDVSHLFLWQSEQ
jgi:hypothetical protein